MKRKFDETFDRVSQMRFFAIRAAVAGAATAFPRTDDVVVVVVVAVVSRPPHRIALHDNVLNVKKLVINKYR